MGYEAGFAGVGIGIAYVIGFFIVSHYDGKIHGEGRRLNLYSFPEYLNRKYTGEAGTAFTRVFSAVVSGVNIFIFFFLLAFAAVTSIIALIEPIARFAEDKWQMKRRNALLVFGALAWAIGLLTVFSFNIWSDVHPLGQFEAFAGKTPFDLIDYFTANVMMPLGGILMALFVGWRIKPKVLADDLPFMSTAVFNAWLWMIRVVVPLAILWVLYTSL